MFSKDTLADKILADFADRHITLSYQTLQFLEKNNFDLGATFNLGVPYLSRYESSALADRLLLRRPDSDPVDVSKQDEQAKEFYRHCRQRMRDWINDADPKKVSKPFDIFHSI